MSPPPLSVVVPVFNGARTLGPCLEALVAQLPEGAELIVVDDASTDETASIAAAFGVQLVQNEVNRGTSASRNRGWRTALAPLIAFVDADVVLRPGALAAMLALLDAAPELMGVNGLLALDLSTSGLVSAFVNTSIHYQHLRHGERVATSFTSLCLFRREALERMGGWDDRWVSRYADDVATRWSLPPRCLGLARHAQGDHLKRVRLRGLLKHRFNIGYFWLLSASAHRDLVRRRPELAILDLRFPLNSVGGGLLLLSPIAAAVNPVAGGLTAASAGALWVGANLRLVAFTLQHRGAVEAALVVPLSAVEGLGCAAGMAWAIMGARGRLKTAKPPGMPHEHA